MSLPIAIGTPAGFPTLLTRFADCHFALRVPRPIPSPVDFVFPLAPGLAVEIAFSAFRLVPYHDSGLALIVAFDR